MTMARSDEAVYIISVAAELAGVHPQTLRIYERRGLIEPYRTPGGTRRYSNADLARLALIAELSGDGVSLEGIKRILVLELENDRLRGQVDRLRRLLENAEARYRGASGAGRAAGTGRRFLPDVRRDSPFDRR